MIDRKPKEFRFPIGGDRVLSIVSPFSGEKPFADRFERMAAQLADLVNMAQFGSTSSGTFGHENHNSDSNDTTGGTGHSYELRLPYTEEMFACGPSQMFALFPLLVFGLSTKSPSLKAGSASTDQIMQLWNVFSHRGSSDAYDAEYVGAVGTFVEVEARVNFFYKASPYLLVEESKINQWDQAFQPDLEEATFTGFYALHLKFHNKVTSTTKNQHAVVAHSIRVDSHQVILP